MYALRAYFLQGHTLILWYTNLYSFFQKLVTAKNIAPGTFSITPVTFLTGDKQRFLKKIVIVGTTKTENDTCTLSVCEDS